MAFSLLWTSVATNYWWTLNLFLQVGPLPWALSAIHPTAYWVWFHVHLQFGIWKTSSLSKTCFSCLGHLLKPETSNSSSWSNNGLLLPPLPPTLTPKVRNWFLTFYASTFSLDSHCSSLPLSLDQWFSNSYLSPLRGFWGWKGRGIELAGLEASHLNRAVACLSILHTIWRALSG